MHVHIGNVADRFELDTVKNVICLNLSCERLLDLMYGARRTDGVDYAMCNQPGAWFQWSSDIQKHQIGSAWNLPLSSGFLSKAYGRRYTQEEDFSLYPATRYHQAEVQAASQAYDAVSWMLLVREAPTILDVHQC